MLVLSGWHDTMRWWIGTRTPFGNMVPAGKYMPCERTVVAGIAALNDQHAVVSPDEQSVSGHGRVGCIGPDPEGSTPVQQHHLVRLSLSRR